MAGTITLSLQQLFDELGNVLSNGQVYFIQAGTTSTPQNAYRDFGLTNPWPNPFTLEADGRLPLLYFADGFIKVRMVDQVGASQVVQDNIPVLGSSSGGGGGGTIDPTTIHATGDIKLMYNFGVVAGFVRANGRTIGSVTSGATERANADALALFTLLWTVDPNLAVSGGRGVSAAADWAANKTIVIPDLRGRVPAGLDDMGSGAASRLTGLLMTPDGVTLGAVGGTQAWALSLGQLPTGITSSGNNSISVTSANPLVKNAGLGVNPGSASGTAVWNGGTSSTETSSNASQAISVTSNNTSGQAHTNVQPTLMLTFYVKL